MFLWNFVFSQVGINTPSPNATLDINPSVSTASTYPKGLLIPRLSGDEIQAMTVGANQNGMLAFATAQPTAPIARTSLINAQGLYYYLYSADRWYNVNQFNNSLNSSLYSVNWNSTDMFINRFTGGGGDTDINNPGQESFIWFVNGSQSIFNNNPYVTTSGSPNRGIKFLKSGVYNVTVQFSFVYARDVAGDGASNANLPDRLDSQLTYNMQQNFLSSPASAYVSNIIHCPNNINSRLGSGQQRVSGIAVGNIIVKQDNVVTFIPEVSTVGYYISDAELSNTTLGIGLRSTGNLNVHIIRVSDY